MNFDDKETKTDWDLRQSRLELIGKFVQEKSLAYRALIKNKSKQNMRNFFQEFQVVFKEVRQFANPKNDKQSQLVEDIEEKIEDLDDKLGEKPGIDDHIELDSQFKTFKKLDEADDKLRQLQMAVGLDIPLDVEREGYGAAEKDTEEVKQ